VSRSIDLFIRSSKAIDEVVSDVTRLTELTFVPAGTTETWILDEGEVHAELRAHSFVDDGDLLLERYQYALSARVELGVRPADSKEAQILRRVSERLRNGAMESLLVHDLQYRDGGSGADAEAPEAS